MDMKFFKGRNFRFTYYKGMKLGPSLVNYKFNLRSMLSISFRLSGLFLLAAIVIVCATQSNEVFGYAWYFAILSTFLYLFGTFFAMFGIFHILYGIYHLFTIKLSSNFSDIVKSIISIVSTLLILLAVLLFIYTISDGLEVYKDFKSVEKVFEESGIDGIINNYGSVESALYQIQQVAIPDCVSRLTGNFILDAPLYESLRIYYQLEDILIKLAIK